MVFCTGPSRQDHLLPVVDSLATSASGTTFLPLDPLFGQLVDHLNSTSCGVSLQTENSDTQSTVYREIYS